MCITWQETCRQPNPSVEMIDGELHSGAYTDCPVGETEGPQLLCLFELYPRVETMVVLFSNESPSHDVDERIVALKAEAAV